VPKEKPGRPEVSKDSPQLRTSVRPASMAVYLNPLQRHKKRVLPMTPEGMLRKDSGHQDANLGVGRSLRVVLQRQELFLSCLVLRGWETCLAIVHGCLDTDMIISDERRAEVCKKG
jgi:hypothetical protein